MILIAQDQRTKKDLYKCKKLSTMSKKYGIDLTILESQLERIQSEHYRGNPHVLVEWNNITVWIY